MSLVVPPYPPPRYTKDEPEVSALTLEEIFIALTGDAEESR